MRTAVAPVLRRACLLICVLAAPLASATLDPKPQVSRIEVLTVPSETLSTAQVLNGASGGTPVTLAGELRLPPDAAGKLPAVILVHGSGGIGPNVEQWARELNAIGVAAFILDSFSARGIVSTVADQSQLAHVAMMVDAYRALGVLSKHPRIDPQRIAVMGFSKGAVAAVFSSGERFRRAYGPANATFAAHIGLYTPCYVRYRDDDKVTGAPIRLFHGLADDWVPSAPCHGYLDRLKAAGADVTLTEYEGAYHAYDIYRSSTTKVEQAKTARRCTFHEGDGGQLVNDQSGKVSSTDNDPCIETGTTLAYNAPAHDATVKAVQQFLSARFGLGK